MTGEELWEVAIELEEENHKVIAYFTLCECGRGRGSGVEPFLGRIVSMEFSKSWKIPSKILE